MTRLTDEQREAVDEAISKADLQSLKEQRSILAGNAAIINNEWDMIRLHQVIRPDGKPFEPHIIDKSGLNLKDEKDKYSNYQNDWNAFARDILQAKLDPDQQAILTSVQHNKLTSVVSGTARGKDFVAAVAAICFLYLTPKWNEKGELIENTKIAMTAPTERQIQDICFPEIARLYSKASCLPGRLSGMGIRFQDYKEWFLTGFKSDENSTESWSGFHAVHTMFVVTEASGMSEAIFNAITGNLQGDSRLLIVFNPNNSTGFAAASQKSPKWNKFRLDSLNAPNVIQKKEIIPGQVNYDWVADRVHEWCAPIDRGSFDETEGDFEWEGQVYRPNDLFRVKVRGLFPKVSSDMLVPLDWIRQAQKRWQNIVGQKIMIQGKQAREDDFIKMTMAFRLGVDVAGMGRDSSCLAYRYGNFVEKFETTHSSGFANHMEVVGRIVNILKTHSGRKWPQVFIDTIGEGAGSYSRLKELNVSEFVYSCKFSEAAVDERDKALTDVNGVYEFLNMRAYVYWAIRDWLDPKHNNQACLPPNCDELVQDLTETRWEFMSNGKVKIESKDDIKKRLKRSPDWGDALANTFWPVEDPVTAEERRKRTWEILRNLP